MTELINELIKLGQERSYLDGKVRYVSVIGGKPRLGFNVPIRENFYKIIGRKAYLMLNGKKVTV